MTANTSVATSSKMHFAFLSLTCIALLLAGGSHAEQLGTRNYDIARLGPILADPLIQHGKETYVLAGCANCHGVNLEPSGEAADLMHSPLVGLDKNGDAIGPVLRAGIPQTMSMSPMPQYSDLSEQQITAIARWIHYARQLGRYQELMPTTDPRGGDAVAGKACFQQRCSGCHSVQRDLARIGRSLDHKTLRAQILKPG